MRRVVPILLGVLWLAAVIAAACLSDANIIGDTPASMSLANSWEKGSTLADTYESDAFYALLSLSASDGGTNEYRIMQISDVGEAVAETPVLSVSAKGDYCDFTADPAGFYLTFLLADKRGAEVYFVPAEFLMPGSDEEEEDENENVYEPSCIAAQKTADGVHINWASYEEGSFSFWTQEGDGVSHYEQNLLRDADGESFLSDAGGASKTSQYRFMVYALLVLAGWVVIGLLAFLLRKRSSTVYMIAMVEAVLVLALGTGLLFVARISQTSKEEERERFADYYLQQLTQEADGDYEAISVQVKTFLDTDGAGEAFADLCVVDVSSRRILLSAAGKTGMVLEDLYDGETILWARTDEEVSWTLAAVPEESESVFSDASVRGYLFVSLLLFAAATALCLVLLLSRDRDMRTFSKAMSRVAAGSEAAVAQCRHTNDMEALWNNLMEIQKKIRHINYDRFRIFESCYRFAPKNIEKIFGKDSITEVTSTDTARLSGSVAFVTFSVKGEDDRQRAEQIGRFLSTLEMYQEQSGGFFVSGCSDLTNMKVLFPDPGEAAVEFGKNFLLRFYEGKSFYGCRAGVFLHDTDFLYGVAGNESQSFPFLLMQESEPLQRCASWLLSMGIRMVMTKEVIEHKHYEGEVRFIGYIVIDERRQDLYEVLDVYSAAERRMKKETQNGFHKALTLFYRHDFYLARSAFSDVLKANASDQMARWYLFACEKNLDETDSSSDVCCLTVGEGPD